MEKNNKQLADIDDVEIMARFKTLLNKYQNQGRPVVKEIHQNDAVSMPVVFRKKKSSVIRPEQIPLLTDTVKLSSPKFLAQMSKPVTLQQIVNAALNDINLEMKASEKKALAEVLANRLNIHKR